MKLWWLRPCREPWGEQALDFVPDEQASQPPDIALAYTKAAEQKKLARAAMSRLRLRKDEAEIPKPWRRVWRVIGVDYGPHDVLFDLPGQRGQQPCRLAHPVGEQRTRKGAPTVRRSDIPSIACTAGPS